MKRCKNRLTNNKKFYKKYTLPDQEEIDRLLKKSTVLNTKRATTTWLNKFENFRNSVKYIGKCTEVADIHELEVQIRNFIIVMKTNNGEDYKATSINACIDALNRHLNQYSVIRPLDLKDRRMFPDLCPTGLLKTVFFYNALFLGLRGGEHYILKFNDFKAKVDGSGIEVCIPRSKTNQCGMEGGTGDILKIPNHPQIISVYEKYFANHPVNASPHFYLQEYTDENDFIYFNRWYKTSNIGEKRMRNFLHELAKECGIDVIGRKITNHSVRKTLVELLKDLGFSDIEVMSVSRHRSLNGLKSYERSKSKMQDLCLNGLSQALNLKNNESETRQNLNSEQLQPLHDSTNVDYQENITNIEISDNNVNVKMNLENLQGLFNSNNFNNCSIHFHLS
ncbi:hypothetical protein RhiirA1_401910 [Rhizophagus irregularis]|uniref:Zinc finger mym-type protein 2-like n=2 Tax=Rhizophagus irregularis TaxID=588596 RepID=A0A2N0R091_9GLOM|nr:hypothetical protein RhiirA1_401910 [Rhizophagus irregularis]